MNGKKDCERLMNALLPLAERMLKEHGEFYPYGGYIKPDGEVAHVGAEDEDTDHPKSGNLLNVLRNSLSEMAKGGECKATAIVFDVRVDLPNSDKKCDAIQVCLEHVDGYTAEVFSPYQIVWGRLNFGVTFAQEGRREMFGEK
jgi:hypothetical protein